MRVMGVTILDAFSGADRAIFDGLKSRGLLAGIADGCLPKSWTFFFLLKSFRPNKRRWYHAWQHEMTKNPLSFRARTRSLDRRLREAATTYDVILQVGGLFAPFAGAFPVPVTLFCDYTTKLAEVNYSPWFGLTLAQARRWYALETDLYQRCALIFTASENTRNSLITHYNIPASRVRAVGEGVGRIHDHPGKTYDECIVLFVGIDFERKGGPLLLDAFARVKAHIPRARLLVAGPRAQSRQDGVEWLGHVTDHQQMDELFSRATVFVLPSLCEPFGLVLVEAMSHGLPVVCSTADAMPEIVHQGETGYLVPPGDSAALTERLIALLEAPSLCSALGRAGKIRVGEHFLWAQVVDRIETGLRTACANR
jgi:glycosyltransferase involved in cell wall biosynthesis